VPNTNDEPITKKGAQPQGMIAVTFALPEESKDLVAKLTDVRIILRGTLPVLSGKLGEKQIAVCHTGVGEDSCRAQMTNFLLKVSPRILISSGFAGGLDPALKVGDIVVARNFSSEAVLSKIETQNATVGTLTTQPEVAETITGKAALAAQTGASAVDMETGMICEFCSRKGIPMLSMRGISDAAGDDLPVSFSIWFDASTQRPRVVALLLELALHPLKIPAFARFVKGISFTRLRLTEALLAAIDKL